MARTDLRVTIDADAAKLEREIERTQRSMDRLARQIQRTDLEAARLNDQLERQTAQALEKVGRGMLVFGAATLAGLGLAAKAAIDWESAWAGVRKTVEGSPEELAQLETELRELATTLPATHAEIAGVAEAAGQLGVATEDVAQFTKVMIDLGETTNLTADEAATSIAQLMNVMQTAPGDVDNLAAALVDLGNNGASTERDIIEMAQRIAGAGAQIGLTEADVLAFANALASLGIEAEAGGTAISRLMADMAKSVAQGGDELNGFAEVAGMTASEFATAFERDPARAITTFVEGLGRIEASGGDVFTVLDDLGLGGIRVRDSLLRMAGGGDILTDSLDRGARAWAENTALIEEAEKRYDTAEAKIAIAKNALVDLAIDIGGVILPAVAALAEAVADLAGWFSDLPGPVKTVLTILAGLVGTVALVGGGFLLFAPRLAAARTELALLAPAGSRAAGALTLMGTAAKVAVPLLAVAGAVIAIKEATKETAPSVEDATQALLNFDNASKRVAMDQLLRQLEDVREFTDRNIFEQAIDGLTAFGAANIQGAQDMEELNDTIGQFDRAFASMVQGGNAELARESAQRFFDEMGRTGDLDDMIEQSLPEYARALTDVDNQQQIAGEGASDLGAEFDALDQAVEDAETALKDYADQLKAMTDPVFGVLSALQSVEEAQSAYNEAVEEFGTDSDEARGAAVNLAEAVAGMEQAVLNGDLSWSDFDATLARWIEQGVLTEAEAEAIRTSVDEARGAAEDYEGDYAAELRLERDKAKEAAAQQALDDIADPRQALLRAKATGLAGPERELNNLARDRTATINVRVASRGGSGFLRGESFAHSGGLVTSSGVIPRFHDGANLTGLRHDEIPAILQTRERVLSRAQNEAFETMIRTLGQPVPVMQSASAAAGSGSGHFTGNLYLSSGEFLGVVDGRVDQSISAHDRNLRRRAGAGTGRAR